MGKEGPDPKLKSVGTVTLVGFGRNISYNYKALTPLKNADREILTIKDTSLVLELL